MAFLTKPRRSLNEWGIAPLLVASLLVVTLLMPLSLGFLLGFVTGVLWGGVVVGWRAAQGVFTWIKTGS